MMKKILAVLMAVIMTCLTGAALASAGDRTLLTTNRGGGYTSEYVENAILSGGKIYLNTMAASNGFYIFDLATGESTRYSMEKMEERMRGINGNEEQKNEDGDTYTESIAGWFGYEDGIYAVVTRSIRQGEESEIDGGYICKAASFERIGECQCSLEICEGKFHQVKRMFESLGNKVLSLKRVKIGGVALDETLEEGEYRYLSDEEIEKIMNKIDKKVL